jgi:hypothetical protein
MVEGLGTDFSDMVDAHERCGVPARLDFQVVLSHTCRGRRPRGMHHARNRPQGAVELADQALE